MTFEKYKALKGADFIKASREHPDLFEQLREEKKQEVLDDVDLRIALDYVARNNRHRGDAKFLEQVRALFVAICILIPIDDHTPTWDAILLRFIEAYDPENTEEFKKYMSEYAEILF